MYSCFDGYVYDIIYNTIGSYISAGSCCASVDNTGKSYSNHLHFELIINGTKVCPYSYNIYVTL
ncbi:MAG: hypothetical protein H5U37_05205 [Caldisericia bacterium]|nr:hypothetical protein [Caldisericia bacterium]